MTYLMRTVTYYTRWIGAPNDQLPAAPSAPQASAGCLIHHLFQQTHSRIIRYFNDHYDRTTEVITEDMILPPNSILVVPPSSPPLLLFNILPHSNNMPPFPPAIPVLLQPPPQPGPLMDVMHHHAPANEMAVNRSIAPLNPSYAAMNHEDNSNRIHSNVHPAPSNEATAKEQQRGKRKYGYGADTSPEPEGRNKKKLQPTKKNKQVDVANKTSDDNSGVNISLAPSMDISLSLAPPSPPVDLSLSLAPPGSAHATMVNKKGNPEGRNHFQY